MGYGISAPADVKKGAHDGPYHIAQEAVGRNRKYQIIRRIGSIRSGRIFHDAYVGGNIGFPSSLEDGADGSFAVAAGFLKAAEIVSSKETLTSLVHSLYIQRISVQIRVRPDERVLLPVNEIVISAKAGVEARMEVIGRNFHFVNHHGRRQNGI